jgi:hypothetical protein
MPAANASGSTESSPQDHAGRNSSTDGAAVGGPHDDNATNAAAEDDSLHPGASEWLIPVLVASGLAGCCVMALVLLLKYIRSQRSGVRVSRFKASKRVTARRATWTASSGSAGSVDPPEAQPEMEIPVYDAAPIGPVS